MKQLIWLFSAFFLITLSLNAQYDPTKIFKPDFYKYKGNSYRSASGQPGPEYWQNQADYEVKAEFDPDDHILKGRVTIDYTNNSPDSLHMLWLQLDQNTVNPDAEVNQMQNPNNSTDHSKGYQIKETTLSKGDSEKKVSPKIEGTRLQIRLDRPVKPDEEVKLTIDYSYELQEEGGGGRSGYMDTENGKIFEFSYWYPRMAVYDDYYGWNTLPFIGGGEMYLDYGIIDYEVTVPSEQVVVGSGVLQNQDDILNKRTRRRLKKAGESDETVMIRKANELDKPVTKTDDETTTWHFKMKNTRDVAWAMSTGFIWDAAGADLSDGKSALIQSVYPKESTEDERGWGRSTEMMKQATEFFSDYLIDYPYEVATSVGGPVGGMEFPGIVFNHWDVDDDVMYLLASHEIGHTWFPMIVGSDERRNPFMDEGLNVFMDIYAQEDFNDGEFAPKRDGEYAPDGGDPNDEIIDVIEDNKGGPTIMTRADDLDYSQSHPLFYFKAAHGLVLLREVILGHDKFDYAFKQFTKNWAYKHPRPEDFFKSMDNASGEDLTWFWNGWFYHNWQLDQAVKDVDYEDDAPQNGAKITVENKDQMIMPILVKVEEENGETHDLKIPADVWKYNTKAEFKVNSTSKIKKVELDPDHKMPDKDRANNSWEAE